MRIVFVPAIARRDAKHFVASVLLPLTGVDADPPLARGDASPLPCLWRRAAAFSVTEQPAPGNARVIAGGRLLDSFFVYEGVAETFPNHPAGTSGRVSRFLLEHCWNNWNQVGERWLTLPFGRRCIDAQLSDSGEARRFDRRVKRQSFVCDQAVTPHILCSSGECLVNSGGEPPAANVDKSA
jgi:hypothetical protein